MCLYFVLAQTILHIMTSSSQNGRQRHAVTRSQSCSVHASFSASIASMFDGTVLTLDATDEQLGTTPQAEISTRALRGEPSMYPHPPMDLSSFKEPAQQQTTMKMLTREYSRCVQHEPSHRRNQSYFPDTARRLTSDAEMQIN